MIDDSDDDVMEEEGAQEEEGNEVMMMMNAEDEEDMQLQDLPPFERMLKQAQLISERAGSGGSGRYSIARKAGGGGRKMPIRSTSGNRVSLMVNEYDGSEVVDGGGSGRYRYQQEEGEKGGNVVFENHYGSLRGLHGQNLRFGE